MNVSLAVAEEEAYIGSTKTRPKQLESGGRGQYCCVPMCENARYEKHKIPSFLEGRNQFTLAEVKESQTIASVRIHIERAIQRIMRYKIIRNKISLSLHGSVNQII